MATVGNLNVNVNARTARFNKKIKGARGTIARFGKKIGEISKKLAKFGSIAAGVAVGALILLTKAGLDSVDVLGKTADKLGILPKRLQELQLAANTTGVTTETFNMAMQRMVRRVSEAGLGFGEAKAALIELGLSAKDISKLPVDEQFKRISDAMENTASQGDRVRLAMKLFDSEGVALVNTMKGGSAALDEFAKTAEDLGLLLEQHQVKTVEKAKDELGFLAAVWRSLGQHLAVTFAPLIIKITEKIKNFIIQFGGMGQVAEFIVKGVMYAGAFVLDVIHGVKLGFLGLKAAVIQVASDIVRGMAWAAEQIETAWNTIKGLHEQAIASTDQMISYVAGGGSELAGALGMEDVAKELAFWRDGAKIAAQQGRETAAGIFNQQVDSSISDFLGSMGDSLGDQAADAGRVFLDTLDEGWSMGKVPDAFKNMLDSAMGEGFKDLEGDVTIDAPDVKGAAETLQTVLGGFKVEGDVNARRLDQQLDIEKSQLAELKKISENISTAGTGGALT